MPRIDRPYVGIPSFLRSPIVEDVSRLDAMIAVLGVPFDEGSPFLPGSRMAPRSIREHSLRFAGRPGVYDVETGKSYLHEEVTHKLIADVGDADIYPTNPERTFERLTTSVRGILDREAMPVVIGGDHSITFAVVRAFDEPIHILQFDAHTDYAPITDDLRFTNGHAFRHIAAMPHVESLTQVGIRSLRTSPEQVADIRADGNRIIGMDEFRRLGADGVAAALPQDARCYVSIDVDALDMSLVPGCVSGEPNGLAYLELRDTLKAVAERADVVGFDFVEVNPALDVGTGATSYLGAHLITEFLGYLCDQPRWAARRDRWLARAR
ncbi:arginase family protein [Pikeienuella sp. HZG-20]|uniref:arginase family protein n=1 Tax=Paludibacillus litoralis TaxID=3133267 RepID=UPI0030EE93BF